MDNLTHSLVGALIGQAGLKKKTGLGMAALVIGANIPDVDVSCFAWLETTETLGFRRGITHGPIAWIVLPLLLAAALWGFDRWQAGRGTRPLERLPVHSGWLYALSFIACLTHPALDWLNSYGIRLLEPFSSRWFYGDTLFIIDLWLWLGMGFATWLSLRREKREHDWQRPAQIALAASLVYVLANSVISNAASAMASGQPAIANPTAITFWRRSIIEPKGEGQWSIDGQIIGECQLAPAFVLRQNNSRLDAFLFWSRTPYAEKSDNGDHVVVRDARFAGRGGFGVELPEVPCVEIPAK